MADTVLWPALEAVRTATAAELGRAGRPVCHFPIHLADHSLPADDCDCDCAGGGQGAAWVRLITASTLVPGAQRATTSACAGAQLLLTLEVGVHRKGPFVDEDGDPSTEAVTTQYSEGISQDLVALHRALLCAPWSGDTTWQITGLLTLGPLGGCGSAVAHVQMVRETCCPIVLSVAWLPNPTVMLGVLLTVDGFGQYGATVDFGDGSPPSAVGATGPHEHTFPAPGTYTVTVADRSVPATVSTTTITVADHAPRAHLFVAADDPWAALLWIDEAPTSQFTVDFGDDTSPVVAAGQGGGTPRLRHTYDRMGRWTVTVTDRATRRASGAVFDTGGLGVRVAFAPDSAQPQIEVLGLAAGAICEVTVGTADLVALVAPPSGQVTHTHPQPLPAGDHTVTVAEVVGTDRRRHTARSVSVPDHADPRLGVIITWEPSPGQGPRTVTVQAPGARVECLLSWGDGAPQTALAVGGTVQHDYVLPPPPSGCLIWVAENAQALPAGAQPRFGTHLVGEPRYIGVPLLTDRAPRAVDLHIAGVQGPTGADRYRVDWGDGSPADVEAAIGDWCPARHTYPADGQYMATVDAPGMPEPVTRTVTVVSSP